MDFYKQVPQELGPNLEYRVALRRRAAKDAGFQQAMLTACKHDFLFFMGAWCWAYEPRPRMVNGRPLPAMLPFVPWPHQVLAILEIKKNLGFEDVGVEKSRGEGMSWIAVLLALHDWLFEDMAKIGIVSSTEKKADNPEDPDSLGWKIDFSISKLPGWMTGVKDVDWKRNIDGHTWTNHKNGARIAAYSATGDVARGGRAKWFVMDELGSFPRGPDKLALASTQHVTNSRLVISTPAGSEGAYYELMHSPSSMVRIKLDWTDNPIRNRGLYQFENGKPVAVDPVNNPLPENYADESKDLWSRLRRKGFKLEGKVRSPWYDHECDRPGATPQSIAQELDRDYGGSMYRIFGHDFFKAAEEKVRAPLSQGVLTYNPETLEPEWDKTDDGPFHLWTELDHRNKPPKGQYVIGADISTGLGGSYTSNSVVHVLNLLTMEQVLEYSVNTVDPAEFADVCMALGHWFHKAYLAWEANGPGGQFTKRVQSKRYPNVYFRKLFWRKSRKKTQEMGWWTDERTKEAMFGEMSRSVKHGELFLHSNMLVKECGQYVRINGKIEHVLEVNSNDDSSKGKSHGDRVIAMCVALQAARDRPLAEVTRNKEENPDSPPPGTLAARQREYEDSLVKRGDEWDSRDNYQIANRQGAMAITGGLRDDW
jgi:hypothetical protein